MAKTGEKKEKSCGCSEKEVVLWGPKALTVDPRRFDSKEMTLEEFKQELKDKPSIGFNAHQRLYTALRMFGYEVNEHGRYRWNFLDDWVNMPGRELHENEVHGLEYVAEKLMSHLEEATVNPIQQKKYILLVGPPGSAKTTLIKIMAKSLDAYATLPEGAVYTVEFDLKQYAPLFSGLEKMVCPAHENPMNFIPPEELEEILKGVNEKVPMMWQKLYPRTDVCPACNYIVQRLKKEGAKIEDVIKVRRIYHQEAEGHNVTLVEFRPTDQKNYDAKELFGGGLNFARFKRLVSDTHPLVLEYGMGGYHDGPSAQRHIVHFSELYKYDEECLNEFLDAVNEKKLSVKQRYPVNLDLVMFGTSNLQEYKKKGIENKSLGEYLTSRGIIIPVPYVVVLDDITKAFQKTVYTKKNAMGTHMPPHFVKWVMGVLNVISAIEEGESFNLDLYSKMLVLNHESPPGLESETEIMRHELIRSATQKPLIEIVEGVKIGIPYRFFQDSLKPFKTALGKIKIPEELKDEHYENCLTNLATLDQILIDTIKSYDGFNQETRERALEEALPSALKLWQRKLAEDVNIALMGNKTMQLEGAKYLAMVFASDVGNRRFNDPQTQQSQPIDYEFLEKMDKLCGVRSPQEFRTFYANAHRHRVGMSEGVSDVTALSKVLLEEDNRFRAMIQKYVVEEILPRNVNNVSTAYSPENTKLVDTLINDFGYCKSCAYFAISAASVLRKNKDGSMFSDGICGDGSCGSCSTCRR